MLFTLLDQVCQRINSMQVNEEAPRFANELRKMRPTLDTDLKSKGIATDQLDQAVLALSVGQLLVIKALPPLVTEMSNALRAGSADPGFRCVLAASLAYLVQPRDLLPDDLPGGYGFLDDALLLYEACALSWEVSGDMAKAEEKRKLFQFLFLAVPDASREAFRSAVSGLATTLNMMRSLGPMVAEMTTQTLIANPLQPIAAPGGSTAPAGRSGFGQAFADYSGAPKPQYTWTNGNTVGVNFPGGGGVAADSRGVYVL